MWPASIGRYQIRERLGQGGMGRLYLALDPAIDRLVAVKLLSVDGVQLHERFLREARLAARLQHPHIVTIFDVGEHEGQPFIAMEYIAGETLAELIARRAPLSLARKLSMMAEVCSALAYAHQHSIVHRDVKPANLMVSRNSGTVKVLDFGIARGLESSITQAGMLMGTPNYMSPEQIEGRDIDYRADIFSVGAVLYELLVYRQPFRGSSPAAVMQQVLYGSPDPVSTANPALPSALDGIVAKALARRPENRYGDLNELRRDLEGVLQDLESASAPVDSPAKESSLSDCLERAEERLAAGDPKGALAHAERAAEIDPDDQTLHALHKRIVATLDAQEVARLLEEARAKLAESAFIQADELLAQAARLAPNSLDVSTLRAELQAVVSRKEEEETRLRRSQAALEEARASLAKGNVEAALRAVAEVLSLAPDHVAARELREAIQAVQKAPVALPVVRPELAPAKGPLRRRSTDVPIDEPDDGADVVVPLVAVPELAHGPLEAEGLNRLIGRDAPLEELLDCMRREAGGAFLVTGYRGVGKTSFVNQIVARLGQHVEAKTAARLVVIRQNLTRPMLPVQLLYAVLRGLSDELDAAGIRGSLVGADSPTAGRGGPPHIVCRNAEDRSDHRAGSRVGTAHRPRHPEGGTPVQAHQLRQPGARLSRLRRHRGRAGSSSPSHDNSRPATSRRAASGAGSSISLGGRGRPRSRCGYCSSSTSSTSSNRCRPRTAERRRRRSTTFSRRSRRCSRRRGSASSSLPAATCRSDSVRTRRVATASTKACSHITCTSLASGVTSTRSASPACPSALANRRKAFSASCAT